VVRCAPADVLLRSQSNRNHCQCRLHCTLLAALPSSRLGRLTRLARVSPPLVALRRILETGPPTSKQDRATATVTSSSSSSLASSPSSSKSWRPDSAAFPTTVRLALGAWTCSEALLTFDSQTSPRNVVSPSTTALGTSSSTAGESSTLFTPSPRSESSSPTSPSCWAQPLPSTCEIDATGWCHASS